MEEESKQSNEIFGEIMGDSDGGDFQYILDGGKCDRAKQSIQNDSGNEDMMRDIGIIQDDSDDEIYGEFDDNFVGGSDDDHEDYGNQDEKEIREQENMHKQQKRKLNKDFKVKHMERRI
jgi:hypothetical protein